MAINTADPDDDDTEGQAPVKKGLFANKKLLIIIAAAVLVVLGGGGAAAYFFLFAHKPAAENAEATPAPIVPPKLVFFDVPDIVVNIQSQDGNPTYLKLSLSLELQNAEEEQGLKVVMPRIVDQFQGYLRELRVEDLQGSASVLRIKEELLRRINLAAAPYHVQNVLLKEMIVQ